jgi:hypothetical protein
LPADQIIVVEVVEVVTQPEVVHYGNPGPRGLPGVGAEPEILDFEESDWEEDPDIDGLSRLVLSVDSYCVWVWQVVGSDSIYRSDTLLISKEVVDGSEKLVIRNGSGDEFGGFLSYFPQGE